MRRVTRVRRDVSQETLLRLAYKAKKSSDALEVLQDALAEKYPDLWTTYTETAERRAQNRDKWYVLFSPRQAILDARFRARKPPRAIHARWGVERPLKLVDRNHLMIRMKFSSREMDFTSNDKIIQNPNKYFSTIFDSDQGSIIVYASRRGGI